MGWRDRRKTRKKDLYVEKDGHKFYWNGWVEPTDEERKERSKEYAIEKSEDGMTFTKWCESCGSKYETVNERKHFCNGCFHKRMEAGLYDNTKLGKELMAWMLR